MGRFTSPDPFMGSASTGQPQSWNRYSYVLNNPLRYSDPEGLDKKPEFEDYDDLYSEQQRILANSKITIGKGKDAKTLSGKALYDHLAKNDPKSLANFLNQTTALMNFQIMLKDKDGQPVFANGATFVNSVTEFKQDRIIANVDPLLKQAVEEASTPIGGFKGLYSGPEDSSGEHGDFDVSFRQRVDGGTQQMSFSSKTDFKTADIDIDYYFNRGAGGRTKHVFLEGLPNAIFKTKTDPYKVREILIKNPSVAIKPNYKIGEGN